MSTQSLRYFPTLEKNNYGQIKKQKFSKATFKESVPMFDKDFYKKMYFIFVGICVQLFY